MPFPPDFVPLQVVWPQVYTYDRGWFAPTGWSLDAESWQPHIGGGTYASSYAQIYFSNYGFPACSGGPMGIIPIYTDFNPTAVYGDNWGNLIGWFHWNMGGHPCIDLLAPNFDLVRTI
jgi:hypothetical protein